MEYLTRDAIDAAAWRTPAGDGRDGASVEFLGIVRAEEDGRPIRHLDYEAYEPMAERLIGQWVHDATARWLLHRAQVVHRVGRVGVGEVAVAIRTQAPHREQAFEACRFLLEAIKRDAPIWKTAVTPNGTAIPSLCHHGTRRS